ncbi:MAG: hypothetical protein DRG30_03425 [Epsilonproteobacteria bacterium]|nr:MAG: hypothetical protein DRG30_03425 [Campylobacterota bacterium]
MAVNIEIKKELTEEEFTRIYHKFQKSIEKQTDSRYLSKSFQELFKQVTPAKEVQLLLVSEPNKILKTITLEKNIAIDISSSKSILAQCYQAKEALYFNDISRNSDYNPDIDNFLAYPLKNLLLLPLLNIDKEIEGIVWAGISQKDFNQYTPSDIKYMTQVSVLSEKMTTEEEEHQEDSNQKSNFYALTKLKSWTWNWKKKESR